jgi:hypothetical protein
MKIIIYTHTDFLDIFKILYVHIYNLINHLDIIIFTNNNNNIYNNLTSNIYIYNDSNVYSQRIVSCLNQMKNKDIYYLVIHENDIITYINMNIFNNLSDIMIQNNIHRIDLCSRYSSELITYNDIILSKNYNFYLFSVGPSIWNINIYEDILTNNMYDYRNIEDNCTQYIFNKKYNVYNTYINITPTYFNRTCPEYITYLHITTRGQFIFDKSSIYYNYAKELYSKYNITRPIYYCN